MGGRVEVEFEALRRFCLQSEYARKGKCAAREASPDWDKLARGDRLSVRFTAGSSPNKLEPLRFLSMSC